MKEALIVVVVLFLVIIGPIIPIFGANLILDSLSSPEIPYNFYTWVGALILVLTFGRSANG